MNLPSQLQVEAAGRHVLTFATGAVTMFAALHLIGGNDAATLSDSINKISTGVAEIAAGLGPIIGLVSAFYAAWSASHKSQVAAVKSAVADGSVPKAQVVAQIQDTPVTPKGP